MSSKKPKSRRLTIFLLKDAVKEADDALEPEEQKARERVPFDARSGIDGAFYWMRRPPVEPEWVRFVRPFVVKAPDKLKTASASGLLVLKAHNRFFAVTFGYGRSLLDLDRIEPHFGLRVCLNRIDSSQMRSVDTKTYEDVVVAKRTQVSKSSDLPAFGINVSSDILRSATGAPTDKSFAQTLSGSDSLVVNRPLEATELVGFCGQLLAAFNDDKYKKSFGWIDDLKPVVDQSVIAELDNLVVSQIQARDTSRTYLAVPDVIDWEDVDAFRIAGTRGCEYPDLDLDEYLANLGSGGAAIRLEDLKHRRVSVRYTRSGVFTSKWKLYQCLVSEQRINGQLHVLMENRWFAVSDSLVETVDTYYDRLPPAAAGLIPSFQAEKEADYNQRLAVSDPSQLLHLDTKITRPGGASSGIELCDIMTVDGEFLHVKRKSRSSTLSHLFAQGSVSAETLISDGEFRDKIRTEIASRVAEDQQARWLALVPGSGESVNKGAYTVSYAVIAPASTGQPWLPFFSKLNLRQHGSHLERLGMKVSVSRIDVETRPAPPSQSRPTENTDE
ncbi:MAG: TIGR04141 family sporadically distributed protein [Bifidobacteriaceae bacterium]|jgi:uncharacterized protein (TIGR04141 family)|nr:TIGR04141 family sporadically distributed protein [Bifidobacteriaceae bacterium]